ncbi:uncharacterized protein LOC132783910 [Drosophila nasuta]|uniref:uncharacterized protein LOC132783910 n=1 Tax=Drosophila nasuta TaxID=42062 RepID=UPI00295E6B4D|nr:uncharacterized protein LOC132783910 [Drosophila nasuta]
MTEKVISRCSWTQTAGNELSQLIPTRHYEEDVFVKPALDDVVNEDRAVLFANNESAPIPCELHFEISPRFKIAALTLVCSAPKVELFVGTNQEYLETIYGVAIEEDEGEGDVPIRPYRYDVEIDRSGIANINLKLLTSSKEICIFGAMLHIAPNPNGITTQQQQPFDLQKIQELLHKGGSSSSSSQSKTEDNEEKMQKFMSLMKGITGQSHSQVPTAVPTGNMDMNSINQHISLKFEQLEQLITKRLDEIQLQQTEKLDRIMALLEKRN